MYKITPIRWALCKAAAAVSKRAYYGIISPLRMVDQPVPELPGPDWVRLKTTLGGVCGTDLALVTLRVHPATILHVFSRFPAVLGHENVSVVDEVGAEVTRWQRGQRVCVEPALGCLGRGEASLCTACAAGLVALCNRAGDDRLPPRALIGLNTLTGGSWATYFLAHQSQLHAVPDAVSDEVAVLIDPIASAAHAVLRRPPRAGESVLVHGAGIIGLGIVAAIRALGFENEILVTARHAYQADLAQRLGATHALVQPRKSGLESRYDGVARRARGRRLAGRFGNQVLLGGFDLTFDCTGSGEGLGEALKWTTARGTLVAVGTSSITRLDTTPIWFDELTVVGSNGRQVETVDGAKRHTYDVVFDWLGTGKLDLSPIPVHRYRLSDYRRAFAELLDRGRHPVVKAAFEP